MALSGRCRAPPPGQVDGRDPEDHRHEAEPDGGPECLAEQQDAEHHADPGTQVGLARHPNGPEGADQPELAQPGERRPDSIRRASSRAIVCPYFSISGAPDSLKKHTPSPK